MDIEILKSGMWDLNPHPFAYEASAPPIELTPIIVAGRYSALPSHSQPPLRSHTTIYFLINYLCLTKKIKADATLL